MDAYIKKKEKKKKIVEANQWFVSLIKYYK